MPRGFPHGKPFRIYAKGPWKRLELMKRLVNAVIKHERIETTFAKAHETQKYVNRLIDVAKHGKENKYCSDMMEFWAEDDTSKEKIFNVLLPRYNSVSGGYTRLAVMPSDKNLLTERYQRVAVLELLGNPLPQLPLPTKNPYSLQNVLIASAKSEHFNAPNKNDSDQSVQ